MIERKDNNNQPNNARQSTRHPIKFMWTVIGFAAIVLLLIVLIGLVI